MCHPEPLDHCPRGYCMKLVFVINKQTNTLKSVLSTWWIEWRAHDKSLYSLLQEVFDVFSVWSGFHVCSYIVWGSARRIRNKKHQKQQTKSSKSRTDLHQKTQHSNTTQLFFKGVDDWLYWSSQSRFNNLARCKMHFNEGSTRICFCINFG